MQTAFLDLLPPHERALMLRGSTRFSYPAGFVSYQGWSTSDVAVVVEKGLVRLFAESRDGRQTTIAYLHPGDIYAVGELIPPGHGHLQALEASQILRLDPIHVFRLLSDHRTVAEAGLRTAGAVLRRLERVITVRSLGTMTERLAFDLLERASVAQLLEGGLVCRVTHEQLADSIASTREVVTRIVGGLRRSGVIATSPGRILVLEPARLSQIVRGVLA